MKRVYEKYNGKQYDVSGFMAEVEDMAAWENGAIGEYFYKDAMAYSYYYKDGLFCIQDGFENGDELGDPKIVLLITKRQAEDFEAFYEGEISPSYKTENMEDGKLYLCEEHFVLGDDRPNAAWMVHSGKDITDYLNGKTDNLVKADILNI